MNAKQRELISDLYRELLDNSVSGDLATAFNNTKSFISEIGETDTKLQSMIDNIENEFEDN